MCLKIVEAAFGFMSYGRILISETFRAIRRQTKYL